MGIDGLLNFEPHWGPEPAPSQFTLKGLEQVLRFVLFNLDVFVSGDAERVALQDLHAGEQRVQVCCDDVLEWDEPTVVEWDEPRQCWWHLDPGEMFFFGLWVAYNNCEVQRQAGDVWKWVSWIDSQRRQHCEDLLVEELAHFLMLILVKLCPTQDFDARTDEYWFKGVVGLSFTRHQRARLVLDSLHHLEGAVTTRSS